MSENVSHLCLLPFQLSPPHHSHLTIFSALKYATKYGQIRQIQYLGTPNMVKWGVPEKSCKMQFRRVDLVVLPPFNDLHNHTCQVPQLG